VVKRCFLGLRRKAKKLLTLYVKLEGVSACLVRVMSLIISFIMSGMYHDQKFHFQPCSMVQIVSFSRSVMCPNQNCQFQHGGSVMVQIICFRMNGMYYGPNCQFQHIEMCYGQNSQFQHVWITSWTNSSVSVLLLCLEVINVSFSMDVMCLRTVMTATATAVPTLTESANPTSLSATRMRSRAKKEETTTSGPTAYPTTSATRKIAATAETNTRGCRPPQNTAG
jgi:hypothetical protein